MLLFFAWPNSSGNGVLVVASDTKPGFGLRDKVYVMCRVDEFKHVCFGTTKISCQKRNFPNNHNDFMSPTPLLYKQ